MQAKLKDKILQWSASKEWIVKTEKFLSSWQFMAILTAYIFITQALGLDLLGFIAIGVLFAFVCFFCKNTNPCVQMLCMAAFCVSAQNSPQRNASGFVLLGKQQYEVLATSTFYSSPLFIVTAVILSLLVAAAVIFRFIVFGDYRRAFSKKGLLWGIVLLSVSFLMSGLFSKGYEFVDFFFAAQQAAIFIVVYLFFASTLDFESFHFDYIANIMVCILLYMIALLAYIYATRFYGFLILSGTWKAYLVAGWGISLDIASYIAMTMPACFYKMSKTRMRYKWIWAALTVLSVVCIYFTLGRGALLAAAVILLLSFIFVVRNEKLVKKIFFVLLISIAVLAVIVGLLAVTDTLQYFFDYFLKNYEDVSSGRLNIWSRYMQYFQENPIFGGGFAADAEASLAGKDPQNGIFNIYSFLAHNLFFQMLGSCGIIGVIALFLHVFSVFRVILKEFDIERGFLVLAILGYLLLSMLDTIFFKPPFIFLYLAILVACEADMAKKCEQIDALRRIPHHDVNDPSYKPRVVFPFVEAGMGHITPAQSISDEFERKYGQYCTVIRSKFYSESGNKILIRLQKNFVKEVKKYNRSWIYGYLNIGIMNLFGPRLLPKIVMDMYVPGAKIAAVSHLCELQPDMVLSTHWSTVHYTEFVKEKPLNVHYLPDVEMIGFGRLACDVALMPAKRGYDNALRKYKKRFNTDNLKLVTCAIRKEAFACSMDKKANRRALGLDENKMTVVMFEGGYGLGRMGKITELLVEKDLPMNVIAICGKNDKLYAKLKALAPRENIHLIVEGFTNKTLEYLSAADVFLGKSGASSVAEGTFFGTAMIITKYATGMERDNAQYYIKDIKNALQIFNPEEAVEQLEFWLDNPEELRKMQQNALNMRDTFGSEKTADVMWEMLCEKFPYLAEKRKEMESKEEN